MNSHRHQYFPTILHVSFDDISFEKGNKKEEEKLENIIEMLEKAPDMLDFDIENKEFVSYYMINDNDNDNDNNDNTDEKTIFLRKRHKQYSQLCHYQYIGMKYMIHDNFNNDVDNEFNKDIDDF